MQIDIQSLAALVGIGAFVWLLWRMTRKGSSTPPVVPPAQPGEQPAPRIPRWHGWWILFPVLEQGSFSHTQTTPSVTGCLTAERRYGIEDNGTGPYDVLVTIKHRGTGWVNPIYSEQTHEDITGRWVPSGQFYWYPLAVRSWKQIVPGGCGNTAPATENDFAELKFGTTTQYLDVSLRIRNSLGDVSEEIVDVIPVAPHFCNEEAKKKTKR